MHSKRVQRYNKFYNLQKENIISFHNIATINKIIHIMTTYNEQEAMQGVAERFIQIAEELHLSGPRLYRDGIVANDQVLSKIKKGWQKPTPKAVELLCKKFGVSAAWMYTGEGPRYLGNNKPADPKNEAGARPFFPGDFVACIDSKGEPVSVGEEKTMVFPLADIDFWCINNDKSLVPSILQGDVIALKRLSSWKEYIPGEFICVVVTADYKVLRKVAVTQDDENSICFVQMVDGNPVESHIPKDIIVEIYKVVGNYRAQ